MHSLDITTVYVSKKNSPLTPKGFTKTTVSFNLQLDAEGNIKEILPYTVTVKNGKKDVERPREEIFPFRNSSSSISAETIDHREKYLFDIDWDKQAKALCCTANSLSAFAKCREKNLNFLQDVTAPVAVAYCRFLEKWHPEEGLSHPLLLAMEKSFAGAKFVISLEYTGEMLHNTAPVVEKWQKSLQEKTIPADAVAGQCALSGQVAPLARIHHNLKGIQGSMATGASLVCYKTTAFESYGKSESYNSSISQEAMEKYVEAFNYLAGAQEHKQLLEGTTLLFWAMTTQEEASILQTFRRKILSEQMNEIQVNTAQAGIADSLTSLSQGTMADYQQVEATKNIEFYILGVRPNAGRLAVKLFHHNTFGEMMARGEQHQRDMRLHADDKPLSLWQLQKTLKSPNSSGDLPTHLGMKLLESILNGTPYPHFLLDTAVYRAKSDQDSDRFVAVGTTRVRIIKGCLTRLGKIESEEYTMVNEASTDKAYHCGRLFAVLEQIQRRAIGQNVNATIKDKFFSTACSAPHVVFPRLLKLTQSHLKKIGGGSEVYYDEMLREILNKLEDSFPRTFSMEKQGMFILGYYQQKEALYTKKEDK